MEYLKKNLIYILIFILAFSVRLYAIHTKEYLFFDSPCSFIASVPNNTTDSGKLFKASWKEHHFQFGKTYKLSEIKKALFCNSKNVKSIIKDIYSISTNPLDKEHPSLYYSILRVWNVGLDGLDTKQMINRGCALNLLFFTFSFFFMYKLLSLIRNDKRFIALGLFFAFLSTGTLSTSLLVREYALMETCLIATVFVFACIYKKMSANETLTPKDSFIVIFTLVLFSLSGYLSNVLSLLMFIVLTIEAIKPEKRKYLKFLVISAISAILSVLIIDPGYTGIFSNTYSSLVKENIHFILYYGNIIKFSGFLTNYLFYNIGVYIFIAFFALLFPAIKNYEIPLNKKDKILISIVCIWAYIAFITDPWKDTFLTFRYIAPSIPVISLLLLNFTYKYHKYIQTAIIVLFLITSLKPLTDYVYMVSLAGKLTYHNNFSYLNLYTKLPDLDKYSDKNLVIVNPNWDYPNFLLYLPNDYNVRFEKQNPKNEYVFDNYLLMNGKEGLLNIHKEYFRIVRHK